MATPIPSLTIEQLIETVVKMLAERDARIEQLNQTLTDITQSYGDIVKKYSALSAKHTALLEQPQCE